MQRVKKLDILGCLKFPLSEILAGTSNFNKSCKIGEGSSAVVYRCVLSIDGSDVTVAVKRLHNSRGSCHNDLEKEVSMVSKFKHRNLVSLIGFCDDSGESIIVYEYVDGGTLDDKLHKNTTDVPLTLLQRGNILICIARALDYLHTGTFHTIIHRDVKSSNIMLDLKGETAKLLDYGIAKIEDPGGMTRSIGTDGYADPAYVKSGEVTSKSDVFSFGVLLAEVLSGKPASYKDPSVKDFATWVQQFIKRRKFGKIIDPKLKSQISGTSLSQLGNLILACLNGTPDERPTMNVVLAQLELFKNQNKGKGSVLAQLELAFKNQNKGKGSAPSGMNWMKKFLPGISRPVSAEPATNNTVDAPNDIGCAPDLRILPVRCDELNEVTDNFAAENLICKGPNANLYKCSSKSKQALFIRSLVFAISDTEEQDKLPHAVSEEEFLAQVSMVSELDHENVVKLLNYCKDTSLRAFVYEYTPKGSLHDILHGQGGSLLWIQRVKIACGAAKGLEYLHEGCSNLVIHCELSSRNILLFDDNVPKIADFNLPIEVAKDPAFLLFTFKDDYEGYVKDAQAPDDIYCFGMVLLELLTGRRDGDPKFPLKEQNLVKWVVPKLCRDELKQCMDPKLGGRYSVLQAGEIARIAQECVQDDLTKRPSARVIAERLINPSARVIAERLINPSARVIAERLINLPSDL